MITGRIVGIKRFEIHDGDGIRTTLFLKGCPLKCVWCHNPESISFQPQVAYNEARCIGCGACAALCAAHSLSGGKHFYDRNKCSGCGRCEEACLGEALTFYGKEITVQDALTLLTEDRMFYEGSGGGVTLSGGEPLLQADFCRELLNQLKATGIHTAVDTCGFVTRAQIDKVIDFTDLFLYDIKFMDAKKHIQYTGQSNEVILNNLTYIAGRGKPVEIRIPLITAINDDQIEPIGRFLAALGFTGKIKVLPYHDFASAKYKALEMENTLPAVRTPDDEQMADAIAKLTLHGLQAISGREPHDQRNGKT
jgi:pyruvate formate lyase activating enzyme